MIGIIVQTTYRGLGFGHKGEERDSVNMVRMRGSFDIVRIGVRLI